MLPERRNPWPGCSVGGGAGKVPCWPGDRRSVSGDQDGISHRDRPSPPRSVLGGVPGAGDVLPAAWRPSALLVHLGTNDFTPGPRDARPPPHTLWLAAVTGWQATSIGHEMSVASFAAAYVELLLNLTAEVRWPRCTAVARMQRRGHGVGLLHTQAAFGALDATSLTRPRRVPDRRTRGGPPPRTAFTARPCAP